MKYLMVNRAAGKVCPTMCTQFSADGLVWTKQIPTISTDHGHTISTGQGHAKPGVVAVPGAFISSQTLLLCPPGECTRSGPTKCAPGHGSEFCGTPGTPSYRK